jgi:hypothetical protein
MYKQKEATMNKRFYARLGRAGFGVSLLLLFAALAPPSSANPHQVRRCVSADVDSPIVLPDGSRHPAGSLQICMSRAHSPVASIHETRVNGSKIGMYLSRTFLNEEPEPGNQDPYLVFRRDAEGGLVLQGYVVPEGQRMRTFLMAHPDRIYRR